MPVYVKIFHRFLRIDPCDPGMSKTGYPYDNAPIERYFNTLENKCTNLYEFRTEKERYQTVEKFAYVTYNHVCPHSYNGYCTPYQVRMHSAEPSGLRCVSERTLSSDSGQYHKIASGVNGKGCHLRYKRTIDAKIYLL